MIRLERTGGLIHFGSMVFLAVRSPATKTPAPPDFSQAKQESR